MRKDISKIFRDVANDKLPKDFSKFNKVRCVLTTGKRIYWYYKEDLEYLHEEGLKPRACIGNIYSGLIFPIPDVETNTELMGNGDCDTIVVMDQYPVEKENCQYTWIAFNRLIDDDNLVEIFDVRNNETK